MSRTHEWWTARSDGVAGCTELTAFLPPSAIFTAIKELFSPQAQISNRLESHCKSSSESRTETWQEWSLSLNLRLFKRSSIFKRSLQTLDPMPIGLHQLAEDRGAPISKATVTSDQLQVGNDFTLCGKYFAPCWLVKSYRFALKLSQVEVKIDCCKMKCGCTNLEYFLFCKHCSMIGHTPVHFPL